MNNIVFFDVRENEIEQIKQFCEGKYNYKLYSNSLDETTEITKELSEADVISVFTFSRVDARILKRLLKLKLIALRCVGFNHIDVKYCKEHDIAVVNSFGYGNVTVAEYAIGLMLDVTRRISRAYLNLKNEHLASDVYTGYELKNSTLGVIGTGAIGTEVIRIAKAFGMNVLAYDLYPKPELEENYNVKYVELNDLFEKSDVISLHAPLTDDNFHLVDEEKIKMMKPNCVLINTARGELIDTKALYEALLSNRIFGAGIDVLESENIITKRNYKFDFDYLPEEAIRQTLINERLLKLHNVVVTPHIAYNSKQANDRILSITAQNISEFLAGRIQNSVVR